MGYALLYEAMLDSVIWARDRYLAPGGLMVPCDMYLCIGPLADPTLIMDKVSFWNDVYGFDMTSMQEGIFNDVVLMDAQESTIAADLKSKDNRHEFLHLDLYTTKPADLVFSGLGFEMKLNKEVDALDGFVIWFDTIFGRYDRGENVNELSTGPHAKYTHWMQTLLLIDHLKKHGEPLKTGQVIKGSVGYERPKDADRQLKISLSWDAAESSEQGKQTWKLE
jgi:protein arginine N-methyltransferase 3